MNDYKAGTVAKATVRGVPDVTVFRYREGRACRWDSAERVEGSIVHSDSDVTDVRPLVVLDLSESVGKSSLPNWLRNNAARLEKGVVSPSSFFKDMNWLADQIEAQTKPPRIPEPKGLGAVVETDGGVRFVRTPDGQWESEDERQTWANVYALRVLSEGVL